LTEKPKYQLCFSGLLAKFFNYLFAIAAMATQKTLLVAVLAGAIDIGMGKSFPDPKVPPEEVVQDALQAVVDGIEEVYPGEQAKQLNEQLMQDPKAVE
jgi:hypothetical protein